MSDEEDEVPQDNTEMQMNDLKTHDDLVKEFNEMPIYHDHLVDDVINQKLNKLNNAHKLLNHQ